jgi:sterol 3beta-glucosyltransferase
VRILVTSFGTRGDIQPYVALGGALTSRGHDVTLAAPEAFRAMAKGVGVRLHPAADVGRRISEEDGLGQGVAAIEARARA